MTVATTAFGSLIELPPLLFEKRLGCGVVAPNLLGPEDDESLYGRRYRARLEHLLKTRLVTCSHGSGDRFELVVERRLDLAADVGTPGRRQLRTGEGVGIETLRSSVVTERAERSRQPGSQDRAHDGGADGPRRSAGRNWIALVAWPTFRTSTAFWMASVNRGRVGPIPTPTITM